MPGRPFWSWIAQVETFLQLRKVASSDSLFLVPDEIQLVLNAIDNGEGFTFDRKIWSQFCWKTPIEEQLRSNIYSIELFSICNFKLCVTIPFLRTLLTSGTLLWSHRQPLIMCWVGLGPLELGLAPRIWEPSRRVLQQFGQLHLLLSLVCTIPDPSGCTHRSFFASIPADYEKKRIQKVNKAMNLCLNVTLLILYVFNICYIRMISLSWSDIMSWFLFVSNGSNFETNMKITQCMHWFPSSKKCNTIPIQPCLGPWDVRQMCGEECLWVGHASETPWKRSTAKLWWIMFQQVWTSSSDLNLRKLILNHRIVQP